MATSSSERKELRRRLLLETEDSCAVPECVTGTELQLHHIDNDSTNEEFENLLLLCPQHHDQVLVGPLDREFCVKLKHRLSPTRILRASNERHLEDRRAFVRALVSHVEASPSSCRAQVVGPLFLHPPWWVQRRDNSSTLPDFDRALLAYIRRMCGSRKNHDIRLVFTLTPRYRDKVKNYLEPDELQVFKTDLLAQIDELWGVESDRGPDAICLDTGFYQIDYIFDDVLMSQSRLSPGTPTEGGWQYVDPDLVDRARSRFDRVFDSNWRGHAAEIDHLRTHIVGL